MNSPPQHRLRLMPSFIEIIMEYAGEPDSILDVGCGPLRGAFKKRFGDRYTGLDLPSSPYPKDCEGDAGALPFGDDSFDAVTAWSVIEHLPCPYGGIMEMVRVARRVVLMTTDLSPHDRDGDPTHLYCWTPKILGHLLRRTGRRSAVRVGDRFPQILGVIWK